MKRLLLALINLSFIVLIAQAQKFQSHPYVFNIPEKSLADTTLPQILERKMIPLDSMYYQQFPNYNYKMPLAGSMPKLFNYIGNNQQGFDIYQTPYDNMYILKPDSTFISHMPVIISLQMQTKPVEIPNPQKERRE